MGFLTKDIHVDKPLTNLSVAKSNPDDAFISEMVLPRVVTNQKSDKYFIHDDDTFLGKASASDNFGLLRGPKAGFKRRDLGLSTATYTCEGYGLSVAIDREDIRNSDAPLALLEDAALSAMTELRIDKELRAAALLFNTSNITQTSIPATLWDVSTSDIAANRNTAHQTVQKATGRRPNQFVIGQEVADVIVEHPQLADQIKFTTEIAGGGAMDALAKFMRVQRVLVGGAVRNSAKEGQALSGGYIWGKFGLFNVAAASPSPRQLSTGYSFEFTPMQIERNFDWDIDSEIVRARETVDEKLVTASAAYLFSAVIS